MATDKAVNITGIANAANPTSAGLIPLNAFRILATPYDKTTKVAAINIEVIAWKNPIGLTLLKK